MIFLLSATLRISIDDELFVLRLINRIEKVHHRLFWIRLHSNFVPPGTASVNGMDGISEARERRQSRVSTSEQII